MLSKSYVFLYISRCKSFKYLNINYCNTVKKCVSLHNAHLSLQEMFVGRNFSA